MLKYSRQTGASQFISDKLHADFVDKYIKKENMEVGDKSKETLLWEELLNEFRHWQRLWDLKESGKMIGGAISSAQFIKQLKSKYYLDLMRHVKI